MKGAWFVTLVLCLAGISSSADADGDLCTSDRFKDAFSKGWMEVWDYPVVSHEMHLLGDEAVPCLQTIVMDGGRSLGLAKCATDPKDCKAWAISTLAEIGTRDAKSRLVQLLRSERDAQILGYLATAVGTVKAVETRPILRKLLRHSDVHLRAQAVAALGVIGDRRDFDVMLDAMHGIPHDKPYEIVIAATGLEVLGDARAIEPLEHLAASTTDAYVKSSIEQMLTRLRARGESSPP